MGITPSIDVLQYVVVLIGYIIAVVTSGLIVRHFVGKTNTKCSDPDSGESTSRTNYDVGAIIGKCENLLTITLILVDGYTGLALIFTAKSIIRAESIKKDPKYYLGGTLVNFTYSVMIGFLIRVFLTALGHPILPSINYGNWNFY